MRRRKRKRYQRVVYGYPPPPKKSKQKVMVICKNCREEFEITSDGLCLYMNQWCADCRKKYRKERREDAERRLEYYGGKKK